MAKDRIGFSLIPIFTYICRVEYIPPYLTFAE